MIEVTVQVILPGRANILNRRGRGMRSAMTLAGFIISALFLTICYMILPRSYWNISGIVSAGFVSISLWYLVSAAAFLRSRPRSGDAVAIASVGPLAAISLLVLLIALAGFAASVLHLYLIAHILVLLAAGAMVVGQLIWRSAATVIEQAAARTTGSSSAHEWRARLERLDIGSLATKEQERVSRIVERLRYIPSFRAADDPSAAAIEKIIAGIERAPIENLNLQLEKRLDDLENQIRILSINTLKSRSNS
ncbi:MAG: hypothetical protein RLZZ187_598 [Pseudomonadota bacterium]